MSRDVEAPHVLMRDPEMERFCDSVEPACDDPWREPCAYDLDVGLSRLEEFNSDVADAIRRGVTRAAAYARERLQSALVSH